jgi:hypothetical protein
MQENTGKARGNRRARPRLTYANVVATLALFVALGGASAFAASQIGKNTIGSRQLKSKAVTTGKLAPNAVNGTKVANGSLTGEDIKLSVLGTVPSATNAANAGNATTVAGHGASCPPATTLIRGICFDSKSNPVANNLEEASDSCAAKGGYLPAPMQLYSARNVLNLGNGVGPNHQYTDIYYYDATTGTNPSTVVIDGTGAITQQGVEAASHYICAYPLVR